MPIAVLSSQAQTSNSSLSVMARKQSHCNGFAQTPLSSELNGEKISQSIMQAQTCLYSQA